MNQCFKERPHREYFFSKVSPPFLFIIGCLFFVSVFSIYADESGGIPDEIVIENKTYDVDRKAPVWFSHKEHAENYVDACDQCHHEYEDGKNVWKEDQPVKKCLVCHHPSKSEGKVKKLNVAFHKNCKSCHRNLAREGDTDAPFKQCTDCHEKH